MARFKPDQRSQDQMFCASLLDQLQAGTLEHAIDYLVDAKVGLELFEARYRNDATGQRAYDPRALLKVILYAYSLGMTSSRRMEKACRTSLVFQALSGGATPDHSTFAAFVSDMGDIARAVFQRILLACDEMGLLGYTHFALDGVKLPSNASREWSGKQADLRRKSEKLKAKVEQKMREQRDRDKRGEDDDGRLAEQIARLERHAAKVDAFLEASEPRLGETGKEINANVTDPESCLMKTRHGMVQGYNAQALVEQENQVIVSAGVEATGHDQRLAKRVLDEAKENMLPGKLERGSLSGAYLSADCQYHSEENLQAAEEQGMEPVIPDNRFRSRDPIFEGRERHKPVPKSKGKFGDQDFEYDADNDWYVCPAGKLLKLSARNSKARGNRYRRYAVRKQECAACPLRSRCLQGPARKMRSLHVPIGKEEGTAKARMMAKIDTPEYRAIYGRRMHIVEPVWRCRFARYGNLRHNKGLSRLTLRGQEKVNAQWLLFCCVHNAEKWAKAALGAFLPLQTALRRAISSILATFRLLAAENPSNSRPEPALPHAA